MAQTEDFKAKTDDQLAEQLGELKREAFNLRFQAATGQLEKASRVKEVRRSIARIKTQQTERSRSAATDRKGVVQGTSVAVTVDLGGWRTLNRTTTHTTTKSRRNT